ncbi:MAG TPA: T6SS immunity protein Tdi1 domain-containing protein [Acidimicrobiales bacterium]
MRRNRKFERFASQYQPDAPCGASPPPLPRSLAAGGFDEFMARFAGCVFEGGLYRIHTRDSSAVANRWVADAYPEFAARAHCFASSWMGNQFALDRERTGKGGENLVLLLEPGTAMGLEVPTSFAEFHDDELVDESDAALAAPFFREWAAANPGTVPLAPSDCVGYKVPLFLGGADTVDNLEVIDLDVYWTLTAQLRRQVEQI